MSSPGTLSFCALKIAWENKFIYPLTCSIEWVLWQTLCIIITRDRPLGPIFGIWCVDINQCNDKTGSTKDDDIPLRCPVWSCPTHTGSLQMTMVAAEKHEHLLLKKDRMTEHTIICTEYCLCKKKGVCILRSVWTGSGVVLFFWKGHPRCLRMKACHLWGR